MYSLPGAAPRWKWQRHALQNLHVSSLPPPATRLQAKAGSGASAVLLLMDLRSQRCYCANVGAAACLLSRISGSFNAKAPEGFFLTQEHTTR